MAYDGELQRRLLEDPESVKREAERGDVFLKWVAIIGWSGVAIFLAWRLL